MFCKYSQINCGTIDLTPAGIKCRSKVTIETHLMDFCVVVFRKRLFSSGLSVCRFFFFYLLHLLCMISGWFSVAGDKPKLHLCVCVSSLVGGRQFVPDVIIGH